MITDLYRCYFSLYNKVFILSTALRCDAVLITNAENSLKEIRKEKNSLELFIKDLGSFIRCHEFMPQIVDCRKMY